MSYCSQKALSCPSVNPKTCAELSQHFGHEIGIHKLFPTAPMKYNQKFILIARFVINPSALAAQPNELPIGYLVHFSSSKR
jgi:hypothetical protein